MTKIIGLLGAAGSGKTTVSKYLIGKYGAKQYTLAAPLKILVGRAFNLSEDQLYGSQESKEAIDPRYNVSPRWLFQRIGTEGIRHAFGEDIWWEILVKNISQERPTLAVCDDVRFVNEAAGLRKAGAVIIRLESEAVKSSSTHASETEWSKAEYDYIINHDGKHMDPLFRAVDEACYRHGICPVNLLK